MEKNLILIPGFAIVKHALLRQEAPLLPITWDLVRIYQDLEQLGFQLWGEKLSDGGTLSQLGITKQFQDITFKWQLQR